MLSFPLCSLSIKNQPNPALQLYRHLFTRDGVHVSDKANPSTLWASIFQPALFQLETVFTPQNGLLSS